MKKSLGIFLSSTAADLSAEREIAARAIEELKLEALRAETFGARPDTPEDTCREMVRNCDVFIGIYGGRYGYVPPSGSLSATEMEFLEARQAGKDILVYIKDGVDPEDRQAEFLSSVDDFEGGFFRRPPFRTLAELEEWIKQDLSALLSSRFVTRTQPRANSVKGNYRSYVVALCNNVSFAGLAQTPSGLSVSLRDIFVQPSLRALLPAEGEPRVQLSVDEVLSFNPRTLIIGAPGSGKTVLLRHLALQAAQGDLQVAGWERVLPVLVPLASWAVRLGQSATGEVLDDHILRFIASRSEPRFAPVVQHSIESGEALVLLDGLDEIEARSLRTYVANGVDDFCRRYPQVKVVVTSRPRGAVPISQFSQYEILPWTDQQIAAFVRSWSSALNEDLGFSGRAEAQAEQLIEAITAHRNLRELARIPLFLTLLAFLSRQGYRLPTRRVELYDALVKTMLGSWDRARSLSHTLPRHFDPARVELLLSDLALTMTTRDLSEISAEEVIALGRSGAVGHHWTELDIPGFLTELTYRSELLAERALGKFSFPHRTLQEFFAAKALANMRDEDALVFITAHYYDPRFEEIIRLALGWVDVRGGRQQLVERAAEELLGGAES